MKKIAFVLSGGGAKGSWQAGVLYSLVNIKDIRPDAIYGTSIGAINAASYAWLGAEKLLNIWESEIYKRSDVMSLNWWQILLFKAKGLFNLKPAKKLLQKYKYLYPRCDAYACKINLKTGEIAYGHSSDDDYMDSVLASASIPLVIEPQGEWVDGGVRELFPLKKAIDDGADRIIIILNVPWSENLTNINKISWWLKNGLNAINIMQREIMVNDIKKCLRYNREGRGKYIDIEIYTPRIEIIGTLDFSHDKIMEAIKRGKEDGLMDPLDVSNIL